MTREMHCFHAWLYAMLKNQPGVAVAQKTKHPNSIVKFRGKNGWSLKELAAASRIDEWTLRQLETGKQDMHHGHMRRLSITFRCEPDELLAPCVSQRNPQIANKRSLKNLEKARGAKRWAGRLTIPRRAHPLVKQLYQTMNKNKVMISDLSEPSGVSRATISDWRYTRTPSLATFEAVLNVLGYKLKIVKKDDK